MWCIFLVHAVFILLAYLQRVCAITGYTGHTGDGGRPGAKGPPGVVRRGMFKIMFCIIVVHKLQRAVVAWLFITTHCMCLEWHQTRRHTVILFVQWLHSLCELTVNNLPQ